MFSAAEWQQKEVLPLNDVKQCMTNQL